MYNIFSFNKDKTIIGEKVVLKEPLKENWKEWAELRQSSRKFLQPWEPKWPSDFLSKNTFYRFISMSEMASRNKNGYNFFVFNKETKVLMGGISLTNLKLEGYKSITLGYWMGKSFAGMGFMQESLKLICNFCFTKLKLNRIEAACVPKNLISKRVLLITGFKVEGFAKKYLSINGKLEDHLLLAKIKKNI